MWGEGRHALCDSAEKVGEWATRGAVSALKFDRLPVSICDTYQPNGENLALYIGCATCHSRRHDRLVFYIEAEAGRLA